MLGWSVTEVSTPRSAYLSAGRSAGTLPMLSPSGVRVLFDEWSSPLGDIRMWNTDAVARFIIEVPTGRLLCIASGKNHRHLSTIRIIETATIGLLAITWVFLWENVSFFLTVAHTILVLFLRIISSSLYIFCLFFLSLILLFFLVKINPPPLFVFMPSNHPFHCFHVKTLLDLVLMTLILLKAPMEMTATYHEARKDIGLLVTILRRSIANLIRRGIDNN